MFPKAPQTIKGNTGNVTNYSDCSQAYLDLEVGGRVVYYITAPAREVFNYTSILTKGSFGYPHPPRNVRLTVDNQFVRRLEWDPAPEAWHTTVLAEREGRMRTSVVSDPWPTWYQVERREFAYKQFGEWYFPTGTSWQVMRSATDRNTSRTYTDNENRGSKLYVYRIMPHNSVGAGNDFRDDWAFDGPVHTQVLQNVQVTAPTVSSVSITSSPGTDGEYAIGEVIEATATFSDAVNVTGSPRLALSVGGQSRTAAYARGSGTLSLVFTHTVAEGDQGTVFIAANAVSLNGGTINASDDASAATLSHSAPTVSGHDVDGVRPALNTASVDGATLTLAYGETLGGNSAPSPGAYAASVAGASRPVTSVSVSGSEVPLTLASAWPRGAP